MRLFRLNRMSARDLRVNKHLKQRQSLRKLRSVLSLSLPMSRGACSPPCSGGRSS
jgi:hypothetical protein